MKRNKRTYDEKWLIALIIYLLGLVLFFEWVRPLHAIITFEYLSLFISFAIFSFGLTALRPPAWLSVFLKTLGLLAVVNYLFLPSPAFNTEWFQAIQLEFELNSAALTQQNWYLFTDSLQVFIFLLIIALVSYLLYFWLVTMKRVFVYISLTIIFVTLMDTFTLYQADQAIVRIVIVSILMLVLNHYLKRHLEKDVVLDFTPFFLYLLVPLMFAMIGLGLISYYAPKSTPIWPDPVPFISHVGSHIGRGDSGSLDYRQVGYGDDDIQLGGTFHMDDTPLFYAEASLNHYWRIESKDYYTGQGWVRESPLNYQPYNHEGVKLTTPSANDIEAEASVQYEPEVNFTKLVYPYGLIGVHHDRVDQFVHDEMTGQMIPDAIDIVPGIIEFQVLQLDSFELSYRYPNITYDQLRQAPEAIPHEIASHYLQLPDELPERVIRLAEEIVADEETRYDQTVAIERYFSQGDFTYQIEEVPIPGDGQDYVDQFLFETQYGYCDNFSTSMVVMLRSVGIPARWAKGFTSGERVEDLSTVDEDRFRYEVTNSNAHSWVEVYFPQVGWIPFEPTIGFSGSDMLLSEDDQQNEIDLDLEDQPNTEEEHELITEEEPEPEPEQSEVAEDQPTVEESRTWRWIVGLIVFLIIVLLVALKWKAILQKLILWHWRAFKYDQEFIKAYQSLLKLLSIRDLKRSRNQTLHAFADQVDQRLDTSLMTELTEQYTQLIYKHDFTIANKALVYEQYRKLIKRVLT